jgi:hypothetical protein
MNLKEVRKEILAPSIAAILAVVAGKIIDHIDPPKFFLGLWQDLFVDIWFIWFGVGVFGLYLLGRFLWNLHRGMARDESQPHFSHRPRIPTVFPAKGYYLDLSDPYRLCFWLCRPRTCLMMAS